MDLRRVDINGMGDGDDLPKLGGGNLIKQINIWADPELRSMYDDLRQQRVNASEIARRAMRRAFQSALDSLEQSKVESEKSAV